MIVPSFNFKIMETVLLDSSIWVSLFARDVHYAEAMKLCDSIDKSNTIIILLPLIYVEVMNVLHRLKIKKHIIRDAFHHFHDNRKIHICTTSSHFWLNEIEKYMPMCSLKSSDLIILAHAVKFRARLLSFDGKMNTAYKVFEGINNNLFYEKTS